MHLTLRLCVSKYRQTCFTHRLPFRFRGKYGKSIPVKHSDYLLLRYDLEREERNMLILRHPYLTSEQSRGHMTDIKVPKNFKVLQNKINNAKYRKDVTLEERLSHLNVTNAWE